MKESISYSFLLNIIILFIFVCAAIVTGIFSYYKAFRANTFIVNEIEKYEGFNCNSMSKIASKLSSISYNLPFDVKCKDGEDNCATDDLNNYKVYSYNIGTYGKTNIQSPTVYSEESINGANIQCGNVKTVDSDGNERTVEECQMIDTYQYGVYTYMYTDLPVVSGLLRIPVYSKTKPLHDFRNLRSDGLYIYDADSFPSALTVADLSLADLSENYANLILDNYRKSLAFISYGVYMDDFGYGLKKVRNYKGVNLRDAFVYNDASIVNAQMLETTYKKKCGNVPDWSMF